MSIPHLDPLAILAFGATMLVPGIGLVLLVLPPGAVSIPTRLALGGVLGYASVSVVALALALVGALTLPAFLVVAGVGSTAVWVMAVRGRRGSAHIRAWRQEVRRDALKLGVLALFLVVFGMARWTWTPLTNYRMPTTFRYWSDAVEMADSHRVPSATLQWNRWLEPTKSKVALNAVGAVAALELGREPMVPMGALLFLMSMFAALSAYALGEALRSGTLAVLVPILLFADLALGSFAELTRDLQQLLAEDWGRMTAIAAAAVAIHAIRLVPRAVRWRRATDEDRAPVPDADVDVDGSETRVPRGPPPWRFIAVSGGLFGVAAGTHLVPTVVLLSFAAAYGLVSGAFERKLLPVMGVGAGIVVAALISAVAILVPPGGDLGFGGAGGTEAYDDLRRELGLPPSFDPTRLLLTGDVERSADASRYDVSDTVHDFLARVGTKRSSPAVEASWWPLVSAVCLALFLVVLGGPAVRAAAGAAVVFAGLLLGVAILFTLRYDLFVLAAFGKRRLFEYVVLAFAVLAVASARFIVDIASRVLRSRERWRWIAPAIAAVLAVSTTLVMVPEVGTRQRRFRRYLPDHELLTWIGQHVPCDGRVLVDRRTLASLEAVSSRVGVLEGMGPHVRPAVLVIALRELLEAQRSLADPAAAADYLRENGVAIVVDTTPEHRLGGWRQLRTGELEDVPFLEPIHSSRAGTVYEVEGYVPQHGLPDPSSAAGYRCADPPTGTV